jgi:uncharacterized membrane protein
LASVRRYRKGDELLHPRRVDETVARRISIISYIQAALLLAMVVAAVSMARGYGYRPAPIP